MIDVIQYYTSKLHNFKVSKTKMLMNRNCVHFSIWQISFDKPSCRWYLKYEGEMLSVWALMLTFKYHILMFQMNAKLYWFYFYYLAN